MLNEESKTYKLLRLPSGNLRSDMRNSGGETILHQKFLDQLHLMNHFFPESMILLDDLLPLYAHDYKKYQTSQCLFPLVRLFLFHKLAWTALQLR